MRIEEPLRSVLFLAVSATACTVQGVLALWPAGVEELNQISRHPHIGDDGHGLLQVTSWQSKNCLVREKAKATPHPPLLEQVTNYLLTYLLTWQLCSMYMFVNSNIQIYEDMVRMYIYKHITYIEQKLSFYSFASTTALTLDIYPTNYAHPGLTWNTLGPTFVDLALL